MRIMIIADKTHNRLLDFISNILYDIYKADVITMCELDYDSDDLLINSFFDNIKDVEIIIFIGETNMHAALSAIARRWNIKIYSFY